MNESSSHAAVSREVIRPTQVEVHLGRLRSNFEALRQRVGTSRIMPILKANAYGHGMLRIASLMEELRADCIGVAVLEEGILLRESGITLPILVMGGIFGNQVPHFLTYNLTMTASSIGKLKAIDSAAAAMGIPARVHLKVDTGMERIGVHHYNARGFLEAAAQCPHVRVEGIFSHFANSESVHLESAKIQLERFLEVTSLLEKMGFAPNAWRHIANSGAILQMPESFLDMVRPGILMYGVYPSNEVPRTVMVKPALTWKSRVVYFKVIETGSSVGYGSSWTADHPVHAVTVPVGYGDGYFRSMSHKASVLIRGKRYPVIGAISMDQIVVNIESDSAYNDDDVVLVGEMDGAVISVEDLARWAGTIPYEILTNINTRVPRVYLE